MPAIVELTPLTHRGQELLGDLEAKTGLLPFKTSDVSGRKRYYLEGSANVDGFQAALDRLEPNWVAHLTFREPTRRQRFFGTMLDRTVPAWRKPWTR
jgi:hypothetical protein